MTFYKKYDYQDQKQGPRYDSFYKFSDRSHFDHYYQ